MKIILFIILGLSSLIGISQFENDFKGIKSEGEIPREFRAQILDSLDAQYKENIKKEDTRFEKKAKSDFLIGSNWSLQRILTSGRVIFGHPMSSYIDDVTNLLLVNEPDLNVSVYILKSTSVNAFATSQGMIFLTAGLLARLENEAQLAFVLAHEISHVKKKHSILQYLNQQKVIHSKVNNSYESFKYAINAMSAYSKQQELEADELGLQYLQSTSYDLIEILNTFEILRYSYLPFGNELFNYEWFETEKFNLPEDWKLDTYRTILTGTHTDTEKEEIKLESHPNIDKRIEKIDVLLPDSLVKGDRYIVSESRFKEMQENIRFETIRLNLLEAKYERALYHAFWMKTFYPENQFLKNAIGKAFYGLYKTKQFSESKLLDEESFGKYDSAELITQSFGDVDIVQGAEHKLVYLLSEMNSKELGLMALRLLMIDPKTQKETERFQLDILKDLTENSKKTVNRLKSEYSKDRVNQYHKTKSATPDTSYNFGVYALQGQFKYPHLRRLLESAADILEKEKNTSEQQEKLLADEKTKKKAEKWDSEYGDYLGIDSVITITPFYYKTSERKGTKYTNSERGQLNYTEIIRKTSEDVDLHNRIFNPLLFSASEVDLYNDCSIVNECVEECFRSAQINMLPISDKEAQSIQKKYGTNKVYFSGVIGNVTRKNILLTTGVVLMSIYVYPLVPVALFYAFNPANETLIFDFIIDIDKGKIDFENIDFFEKQVDAPVFVESQLRSKLFKVKNNPKKESPLKQ